MKLIINMFLPRIQDLINEIQVRREKSKDSMSESSSQTKRYSKKWTSQEENLLCDLIVRFGSDFTLLEQYFPHKTRKQIKKKYKLLSELKQRKLQKIENQFQKQRRKSFFDEQILEQNQGGSMKENSSFDLQKQSFL